MSRPKLSILVPFKKASAYIDACLKSIAQNSYGDYEALLINDFSTDGSSAIVKNFCGRDSRFKVLAPKVPGLIPALNTGLQAARGEYIARLDADDLCRPNRFALQTAELDQHPEISLTSCRVETFSEGPLSEGHLKYMNWVNTCQSHDEIARGLLIESPLVHPSVMFRKKPVLDLGGYIHYEGPEDYDLWLRMKEAGLRFSKVPETLLYWRQHSQSLSKTDGRYSEKAFERRKFRHLLTCLARPEISGRKIFIFGAGKMGGRLGRHLLQNNLPLQGFADIDPAKIGGKRHGLPIYPPEEIFKTFPRSFFLGYVTTWGAREILAGEFKKAGFSPNEDFFLL